MRRGRATGTFVRQLQCVIISLRDELFPPFCKGKKNYTYTDTASNKIQRKHIFPETMNLSSGHVTTEKRKQVFLKIYIK